jgi:signal transduction histidine kinase
MNLQLKIVLFIIFSNIFVVCGIFAANEYVVNESLLGLDQDMAQQQLDQVVRYLEKDREKLHSVNKVLANSIVEMDEEGREKQLKEVVSDLDLLNGAILSASDSAVLAYAGEYEDRREDNALNRYAEVIFRLSSIDKTGYYTYDDVTLMVSTMPVGEEEVLLLTKALDQDYLGAVRGKLGVNFSFENNSWAPISEARNSSNIVVSQKLFDTRGMQTLSISLLAQRQIASILDLAFDYIVLVLLVSTILVILLTYITIKLVGLNRITKLVEDIKKINTLKGVTPNVRIIGRDEIGYLASQINKMLKVLEISQKDLVKANSKLSKENERIEEAVVVRTKQLKAEQTKLKVAVDSIPEGMVIFDHQKRNVLENLKIHEILEIKEVTFDNLSTYLAPDINLGETYDRCMEQKTQFKGEDIKRYDKFLRCYLAPIIEEGEKVHGILMQVVDITDLKMVEQRKEEFFSIASHELRTPLTAIKGNIEMLKQFYADIFKDEDVAEMFNDMHDASSRLISIVNDFLVTSRIDNEKLTVSITEFDIDRTVETVIHNLTSLHSKKKQKVEHFKCPNKVQVFADENFTQQILVNLIGNSIKYTQEGGLIQVSTKFEGDMVYVRIKDNGRGIPSSELPNLFAKFKQVNSVYITRDTTSGTGLGLYISRNLARAMHGEVEVEWTKEGEGTVFALRVPVADTTIIGEEV